MSKQFYVYVHFYPDLPGILAGEPMYVGKGCGERSHIHFKKSHNADLHELVEEAKLAGVSLFEPRIYYCDSEKDALAKEIALIKLYGRADLGEGTLLNKTDGGQGMSGNIGSQRQKEVTANLNRLRIWTVEARALIGNIHKGRVHSQESRAKMSAAGKGRKKSVEHREKIAAAHRGKSHKPMSPETRAALSRAHKGKKQDPAFVERRIAPLRGRPSKLKGRKQDPEFAARRIAAVIRGKKAKPPAPPKPYKSQIPDFIGPRTREQTTKEYYRLYAAQRREAKRFKRPVPYRRRRSAHQCENVEENSFHQ